jgi:hypothetical protein
VVPYRRLPLGLTARIRLKQPVRTLLTLTILATAACDRAAQLAAPVEVGPDTALLIDRDRTNSTSGDGATTSTYSTLSMRSNASRCLELSGSPSSAGVKTKVAACATKNTQQFTINASTKQIVSSGGLCLTALGSGNTALGADIGLAPCSSSARQKWTLNASNGRIEGPNKGCITVRGSSLTLGAGEFLGSCGWFPTWAQGYRWTTVSGPTSPPTTPPPAPATSISITPQSVVVAVGGTSQLVAVARDANGQPVSGATFSYAVTMGGTAAAVSSTGLVTGKAAGKDTVRVTSGNLSTKVGISVTATAPPPNPPPPPPPPPTNPPPNTPPPSGLKAIDPTMPLDSVRVLWPIRTGKIWPVHAGDNLQNVLNQAQRGDEIVIDPGITFTGNFVLPAKAGTPANGWILVRSANTAGLPPAGARATARHAIAMPKLNTPNVSPALATAAGASGWYIAGIEFQLSSAPQFVHYGLVNIGHGNGSQNTIAKVPTQIVLDRVYIHGSPNVSLQRCVALNSAHTAIVNSTLSQCAANGFDSQAIGGWNGPGPFRIENNYLEGAGENIMFGGADPSIANLVPSDITIRGNHITKPTSWAGKYTIKNLLETKNARRVLIENNILESNWVDGQTGFAIVLKSANQGGSAPWSVTSDIMFRYNILRKSAAGFSIAANPSAHTAVPASRIKIEHNLIYEVGSYHGTTNGRMVQLMQRLTDMQVVNNTLVHNAITGQFILIADQGPATRLIIRDNISTWGGPWGAVMGLAPQGTQALAAYAPGSYSFDRNVVGGMPLGLLGGYPSTSFYPLTLLNIGFMNALGNDFRLSGSSPYAGKSTTGGNPGADVAQVLSRTANVIVP